MIGELSEIFISMATQLKCLACISMPKRDSNLLVSEQLLIKGCIARERSSQAKLYHLYSPKMLGVCMWYAHNKEEAEEILQDGFMRVFTYINKYEGIGSFEGWIRKIMVNAALLKYRNKSSKGLFIEFNAIIHDQLENSNFLEFMYAKDLVNLVQTLSPAYRMVFSLHVLEGFKHREIAEQLGISEGTSKSNLADAKEILKRAITGTKKMAII